MSKILSWASLALGILFYVVGVLGLLWPKSPPTDVGLVSTSVLFVLFGLVGLLLNRPSAAS